MATVLTGLWAPEDLCDQFGDQNTKVQPPPPVLRIGGETPLSSAAVHGQRELARSRYLPHSYAGFADGFNKQGGIQADVRKCQISWYHYLSAAFDKVSSTVVDTPRRIRLGRLPMFRIYAQVSKSHMSAPRTSASSISFAKTVRTCTPSSGTSRVLAPIYSPQTRLRRIVTDPACTYPDMHHDDSHRKGMVSKYLPHVGFYLNPN